MQAAIVFVAFVVRLVAEGIVLVQVLSLEEGAQVDLSLTDAPLTFGRHLELGQVWDKVRDTL